MTIDPATATPREWVTLNFHEAGHGTNFTLETWTGPGWERRYYLVAHSISGHGWAKAWWRVGEGGGMPQPYGMPSERVIVPPIATAGVYRLCELRSDEPPASGSSTQPTQKACALLTVI